MSNSALALVRKLSNNFNRHDAEAVGSHYAPNAVMTAVSGEKVEGRAGITAYFAAFFTAFSDIQMKVKRSFVTSTNAGAVEYAPGQRPDGGCHRKEHSGSVHQPGHPERRRADWGRHRQRRQPDDPPAAGACTADDHARAAHRHGAQALPVPFRRRSGRGHRPIRSASCPTASPPTRRSRSRCRRYTRWARRGSSPSAPTWRRAPCSGRCAC